MCTAVGEIASGLQHSSIIPHSGSTVLHSTLHCTFLYCTVAAVQCSAVQECSVSPCVSGVLGAVLTAQFAFQNTGSTAAHAGAGERAQLQLSYYTAFGR